MASRTRLPAITKARGVLALTGQIGAGILSLLVLCSLLLVAVPLLFLFLGFVIRYAGATELGEVVAVGGAIGAFGIGAHIILGGNGRKGGDKPFYFF